MGSKVADITTAPTEKAPIATIYHAFFLGLAMKLGGCTISWNYALYIGFYEYLIVVISIGVAYIMLGLCMAEMISIMSFSGGYYGYARCAIGPLGGFLVGCSGAMESIFYLAMYVLKIGQFCTIVFDVPEGRQPIVWIITYLILITSHIMIGKYFWHVAILLGIGIFTLVLIFLFGSMQHLDFQKYAIVPFNDGYSDDPDQFFSVFRSAVLFFIGFDMLTIASNDIKDAKNKMPYILVGLVCTLFVLAIWLMVTVSSQAPGIGYYLCRIKTFFPLVFGFQQIFNLEYKKAIILAAIPSFGTAFSYLYIVSRQLKSMATSGLLPPFFKWTYGELDTPVTAMILVACIALGGNYFAWREDVYTTTSRVATIAACFVYLSMFYCFILFRKRFGHLERSFKNPFGIFGALFGAMIFLGLLAVLLYFDHDIYYPMTAFYFSYIGAMLIYYYLYAESHQCFSATEQKVFFKVYILNMQMRKKKAVHKRFANDIFTIVFGLFGAQPPSFLSPRNSAYKDSNNSGIDTNRSNQGSLTRQQSRLNTSISGNRSHSRNISKDLSNMSQISGESNGLAKACLEENNDEAHPTNDLILDTTNRVSIEPDSELDAPITVNIRENNLIETMKPTNEEQKI